MKKIRILSLDGGGIRGILAGTILAYIEEQLKKKTGDENASIARYFDLIAGSSTGGILSLFYICPGENGQPRYTARQALDIFLERGEEIFDASLGKQLVSLGGIRDEKYEARELEAALKEYFGGVRLSQALKPCLIPSYDLHERRAHFFTSLDAVSDDHDFFFRDVGRATSAAPTYFEPVMVKPIEGDAKALIDGGVFANNPSLCAYAEARNIKFSEALNNSEKFDKPGAREMVIVSIGTGEVKKPYPYEEFKNAGVLKWMKPLIDIMLSGNSETVDYQLKQIFETLPEADSRDYHRVQPRLVKANSALDNAKRSNITALYLDGVASVQFFKEQLDEIVDKLILNH